MFPLVSLWTLAQSDRAAIAPSAIIGDDEDEADMRATLSRLMRIRVVGVIKLLLRFAFD
jgi:hypothetical protein